MTYLDDQGRYLSEQGRPDPPIAGDEADALVPEFLAFAEQSRTADEMVDWLEERLGESPPPGVWSPLDGGIEATAFHPLPADIWDGFASEARSLTTFLANRQPDVYRRYNHWWAKLPDGEVRVLAG